MTTEEKYQELCKKFNKVLYMRNRNPRTSAWHQYLFEYEAKNKHYFLDVESSEELSVITENNTVLLSYNSVDNKILTVAILSRFIFKEVLSILFDDLMAICDTAIDVYEKDEQKSMEYMKRIAGHE